MRKRLLVIAYLCCFVVVLFLGYRCIGIKKDLWFETEMFPIEMCQFCENIYYVGKIYENGKNTYALYKMEEYGNKIEKVTQIEIDINSTIEKMASTNNNLYLIVKVDRDKREIWEIDCSEKVTAIYDITQLLDVETSKIRAFCVDEEDVFYIREMNGSETILYKSINGIVESIPDSSEELSFESMSIGSDGSVYILFCRNLNIGGGYEIVEIRDEKSMIIHCGELLPYTDIYSVMGKGNEKYEVLIKGTSFVYGYDKEADKVQSMGILTLEKYQYTKSCFIDGKELMILGMNPQYEKEQRINRIKFLRMKLVEGELK